MARKYPGISLQTPKIEITLDPNGEPMLRTNLAPAATMVILSQLLAEIIAVETGAKPKATGPQIIVPGGM